MNRKVYHIYGKYNGNSEEIDATTGYNSAMYLVREYQMAYGNQWQIWAEDNDGNRLDF